MRTAPVVLGVLASALAAGAVGATLWWEAAPRKALAAEVAAARASVSLVAGPASLPDVAPVGVTFWATPDGVVVDPSTAVHLPDRDPEAPLPSLLRYTSAELLSPDEAPFGRPTRYTTLTGLGEPFYVLEPSPPFTVALDRAVPKALALAVLVQAMQTSSTTALAYARPDGSLGSMPLYLTFGDAWIARRVGAEVSLHFPLPKSVGHDLGDALWADEPLVAPATKERPAPERQLAYVVLCDGDDCGTPLQGALAEIGRVIGRRPNLYWLVNEAGVWGELAPSLPPLLPHTAAVGLMRGEGKFDHDLAPLRAVLAQARAHDKNAALLLENAGLSGSVLVEERRQGGDPFRHPIQPPEGVRQARTCYLNERLTDETLEGTVARGPAANNEGADPRLVACAAPIQVMRAFDVRITFSPEPW